MQIDLLPFALHNPLTDLGWGLFLLVHGIGVVELFQAHGALGAVRALEATMQAVMSHAAIAVAVARLLVQHGGNLRRQFVRVSLKPLMSLYSTGRFCRP